MSDTVSWRSQEKNEWSQPDSTVHKVWISLIGGARSRSRIRTQRGGAESPSAEPVLRMRERGPGTLTLRRVQLKSEYRAGGLYSDLFDTLWPERRLFWRCRLRARANCFSIHRRCCWAHLAC
ncbi:hypothetical protein MHYP_G00229340 [Metynnis hypsauchen]